MLPGPSNLRWIIEKCVAFFLCFSLEFVRNCGFGKILGAGLLEYPFAFDALVSESRFSLQGLACREQKLATFLKSPLPLPHILQQYRVWLASLDRAQTIGHPRLHLLPHSI